ncbi:MAG: hypothetical protein L0241_21145 [Planctomycetia bacterium]|nr:hypothetical protein [Planctomycetia bacterium]
MTRKLLATLFFTLGCTGMLYATAEPVEEAPPPRPVGEDKKPGKGGFDKGKFGKFDPEKFKDFKGKFDPEKFKDFKGKGGFPGGGKGKGGFPFPGGKGKGGFKGKGKGEFPFPGGKGGFPFPGGKGKGEFPGKGGPDKGKKKDGE